MLLDAVQPIMLAEQTIPDPNHFIDACALGLQLYSFTLSLLCPLAQIRFAPTKARPDQKTDAAAALSQPAFLDQDCYLRVGSSTMKATGPQIAAVSKLFSFKAAA